MTLFPMAEKSIADKMATLEGEKSTLHAENERLLDLLSRIDQEISAGTSVSVGLGSRQRVDFWHSLCAEIKSALGEKP